MYRFTYTVSSGGEYVTTRKTEGEAKTLIKFIKDCSGWVLKKVEKESWTEVDPDTLLERETSRLALDLEAQALENKILTQDLQGGRILKEDEEEKMLEIDRDILKQMGR